MTTPTGQQQRVSVRRSNVVATVASLPILAAIFFTLGWFVKPSETAVPTPASAESSDQSDDSSDSTNETTDSTITDQATTTTGQASAVSTESTTPTSDTLPTPPSTSPETVLSTGTGSALAAGFTACQKAASLDCLLQQIRALTNGPRAKLLGHFEDIEFHGAIPTKTFEVYVTNCGPQATRSDSRSGLQKFDYSAAVVAARDAVETPGGLAMNVEGNCTRPASTTPIADLALIIVADLADCAATLPKSGVLQQNNPTVLSVAEAQFYPEGDTGDLVLTRCPMAADAVSDPVASAGVGTVTSTTAGMTTAGAFAPPSTN